MSEDSRTPDQIQRDIERRRAEMSGTIDALQDRLSPGQMMDQAFTYFQSSNTGQGLTEFGQNLGRSIRDNPLPLVLLGAGLGWLLLGGGPSSGRMGRRGRALYEDYYADDDLDELDDLDDLDDLEPYDPAYAAAYDYDPGLNTTDDLLARGSGGPRGGTIYGPDGTPARTVPVGDDATGGSGASAASQRAGDTARRASESVSSGAYRTADAARQAGASAGESATRAGEAARASGDAVAARARRASARARLAAGEARSRASRAAEGAYAGAAAYGDSARARYARARARMGEMSDEARLRAREGMTRAQLRAEEMRARARAGLGEAGARARRGAGQARDSLGRAVDEQPLAVAAVGFAVGAALGALLPPTRREDEWFGATRDELRREAEAIVREETERAQSIASAALRAAQEEAEHEGLSREGASGAIRSLADRLERVLEAVREEADRQGLSEEGVAEALRAAENKVRSLAGVAADEAERQGLDRLTPEEGMRAAEEKVRKVAEAAREGAEREAERSRASGSSPSEPRPGGPSTSTGTSGSSPSRAPGSTS